MFCIKLTSTSTFWGAFCSWPMSHPVCYGLGNEVYHRVEHRAGQCNPGNAIVWVGGGEVGRWGGARWSIALAARNIQHKTTCVQLQCTAHVSRQNFRMEVTQ